jgi:hypothetical protein
MITFIITKEDNTKTIQFSNDGSMLDLKKEIINHFDLNCDYIDLFSTMERPIRVMGKFNFDKGLQPRTLDNYPFNRFGIDEREITISYEEVTDYLPQVKLVSVNTLEKYSPPNETKSFNINSDIEFPSLH